MRCITPTAVFWHGTLSHPVHVSGLPQPSINDVDSCHRYGIKACTTHSCTVMQASVPASVACTLAVPDGRANYPAPKQTGAS